MLVGVGDVVEQLERPGRGRPARRSVRPLSCADTSIADPRRWGPGGKEVHRYGRFQRMYFRCTVLITWETAFRRGRSATSVGTWDVKQHEVDWSARDAQLRRDLRRGPRQGGDLRLHRPLQRRQGFHLHPLGHREGVRGFSLVVSFDHWFYRPRTLENRKRTFRRLGVDVLTFTPNWQVVRRLMLEALSRKGDFCWHHAGVFAYPMQMAVKLRIPLLIWGEGEGNTRPIFRFADLEQTDEWKFNRRIVLGMRAEDMAGYLGIPGRDLAPYVYPTREEPPRRGGQESGKYRPWGRAAACGDHQEGVGLAGGRDRKRLPGAHLREDRSACSRGWTT